MVAHHPNQIDRAPVKGHEAELDALELEVDPESGLVAGLGDVADLGKDPGTDLQLENLNEAIQDQKVDPTVVITEVQTTGVVVEVAPGKEKDIGVNIPGQEVGLVLEAVAGEERIQSNLKL